MPWKVFSAQTPPPVRELHVDERDPGHTPAIAAFFGQTGNRARLREVDNSLCVRLIAASYTPEDADPQLEVVEARLHTSGVMMRRRAQTGSCTALTDAEIARQWAQLPDGQRDTSVLFLLIVNTVVEAHHDVLDELRARVDRLDQQLLATNPPLNEILAQLQHLGSHLGAVRDGLIPLRSQIREVLELREPVQRTLISAAAHRWVRNLERDLTDEVPASLMFAEKRLATTMANLHGERSESTNRIVALLTVLTTAFFLPTLVTGLYGMNVPLPAQRSEVVFWVVVGLSVALILVAGTMITKMGLWGTFRRLLPTPKDLLRRIDLWPDEKPPRR